MIKPKRHHYVPQFFLKAWGNSPFSFNVKEKKWFQTSTANIALERNLYKLNDEIESTFITPYIDGFSNDIKFAQDNPWDSLSEKQKESIYKFIILLDARNPYSIEQMKEGCSKFIPKIKQLFSNSKSSFEKNFLDGAENGVLILVLTAIDEIGIESFEKSGSDKNTFEKLSILIILAKEMNIWPLSYLPNFQNENIFFEEFTTEQNELIASDSPMYRRGDYSKGFSVAINMSPKKAYFISNQESLIECYKSMGNQGKIQFFNTMAIEKSSFVFIKEKTENLSNFIKNHK